LAVTKLRTLSSDRLFYEDAAATANARFAMRLQGAAKSITYLTLKNR